MQQNPFFLILGVILGCARVHPGRVPGRAFGVLCVLLGRGVARLFAFLGQAAPVLWGAGKALNGAIARNLALLAGFGWLTEAAGGGEASLFLLLFLAAKLPWSGGNARMLRCVTGLGPEPPSFDGAAFEASLAPLPDAELRRRAASDRAQMLGSLPDRQRRELTLRVRAIYRTLDRRQQNRQGQNIHVRRSPRVDARTPAG